MAIRKLQLWEFALQRRFGDRFKNAPHKLAAHPLWQKVQFLANYSFNSALRHSNQIYLVKLKPRQLTQAYFLQKNQTLQNVFLISVMLRWHRASVACKYQSF